MRPAGLASSQRRSRPSRIVGSTGSQSEAAQSSEPAIATRRSTRNQNSSNNQETSAHSSAQGSGAGGGGSSRSNLSHDLLANLMQTLANQHQQQQHPPAPLPGPAEMMALSSHLSQQQQHLLMHQQQQQQQFAARYQNLSAFASLLSQHRAYQLELNRQLSSSSNQSHNTNSQCNLSPLNSSVVDGGSSRVRAPRPGSSTSLEPSSSTASPQKSHRRSREAYKCRKNYGTLRRDLWCKQCKWKKACTRFLPPLGHPTRNAHSASQARARNQSGQVNRSSSNNNCDQQIGGLDRPQAVGVSTSGGSSGSLNSQVLLNLSPSKSISGANNGAGLLSLGGVQGPACGLGPPGEFVGTHLQGLRMLHLRHNRNQ